MEKNYSSKRQFGAYVPPEVLDGAEELLGCYFDVVKSYGSLFICMNKRFCFKSNERIFKMIRKKFSPDIELCVIKMCYYPTINYFRWGYFITENVCRVTFFGEQNHATTLRQNLSWADLLMMHCANQSSGVAECYMEFSSQVLPQDVTKALSS